jgi:hypothetical protein
MNHGFKGEEREIVHENSKGENFMAAHEVEFHEEPVVGDNF